MPLPVRRARALAATSMLLVGVPAVGAQRPAPTLILTGGKVFTADSVRPWAEAVAIRGDRIVAVGTTPDVQRLAGRGTRRIDLGGRVMIPGINDAHTHLAFAAPIGATVGARGDFVAGPAPAALLDSLAALARRTPRGTWLRGDFGMRAIGDTAFRRAALDRVAPDHPVALFAPWGHVTLVNTRGLRAVGIAEDARDPLAGWLERAPGGAEPGALTGLLEGYAQWPVWAAVWRTYASAGHVVPALQQEAAAAAERGVTTIQNMSTPFDAPTAARVFRAAALPQRVRVMPMPATSPRGRELAPWRALPAGLAPTVRRSGMKYVIDGTPIEGNALQRRAYTYLPHRPDWHGRHYFPADTLRAILREALTGREPLILHVVGDSAMSVVLGAMEAVAPDSVWRPRRVRLDHAGGLGGADVARAARKGVIVGQPRGDSPLRTWLAAGLAVAFGTDASGEPWRDVVGHVAPRDTAEAITRERAVVMMTRDAAYAEFAEREKGTLAPGMLADLAVLSQDVFTVPATALPATRSVLTLIGGRVVHDALSPATTPRTRPR
ncbi:MAG TPA: amidohydrolase family protein [Gemmatirosa sp.]|nr:amidohydrolase family protein [Gemmatirosa sp.]